MKVYVDASKCDGYANCVEVAPDIFEMNSSDSAIVVMEEPPEERRDAVVRAIRLCPADAISIEES